MEIGIVCGQILEFLEKKQGFANFNEIKSVLGVSDHLILMALGWLCHKEYIQVAEDSSAYGCCGNDLKQCLRSTLVFAHEKALLIPA